MGVSLDVEAAIVYFDAFMYGPLQSRARLFRRRGLKPRVVMPEDWEVFAAILLRDPGRTSQSGPDLAGYEVKSALHGNAFEYQYHKRSWQEKMAADRQYGHVFISHRDDLAFVEVRIASGAALSLFVDEWESDKPYTRPSQQRFRKSVPFRWVVDHAELVLRIEDGETSFVAASDQAS